jgi:hypothetical protein
MKKLILLLIMLTFAWTVEVEAQTPTPSVDGYFNPLGQYEDNGLAPDGWSSYSSVLGYHQNQDGTVQVFTNFDTLAGQFIDYSFIIDGENWYPSSEMVGTYGAFYFNGMRYTFGDYGVANDQGQVVVSLEWSMWGSHISHAFVDSTRNQVLLLKQTNDNPEDTWDLPSSSAILWDGTTEETVGSGMTNVTSVLAIPSEPNSVFITANYLDDEPALFKLDLEQRMFVELSENQAFPDEVGPVGTLSISDGNNFLGKPAIVGFAPGWGGFVSLLTENGWSEIYTEDFTGENRISVSDDGTKLYCLSDDSDLDGIGYVSGVGFTTDMETWTPVIDERGAKCVSASRSIMLWSKGTMWILAESRGSAIGFRTENENESNLRSDIFVLKDTYTPYTDIVHTGGTNITIHPNPATEEFIYGFPLSANLFALDGRIVKTINENETSVDVRDVPSGIYILTLSDGSNSRIVITH